MENTQNQNAFVNILVAIVAVGAVVFIAYSAFQFLEQRAEDTPQNPSVINVDVLPDADQGSDTTAQ
jgi:hypothetical protein